jgi:hypothetical protein
VPLFSGGILFVLCLNELNELNDFDDDRRKGVIPSVKFSFGKLRSNVLEAILK